MSMSNVRLSNESLLFYKKSKANAKKSLFVSYVRAESSDSDNESDSSYSDNIVETPRIKTHSEKLQSDDKIEGVTPLRSFPVNLGKRLSENVLSNTPSRILQLAFQEENEKPQDDLNGLNLAAAQTSQIPPQTLSKTQQVSIKDQEKAKNSLPKAVKSHPKRKQKGDPVSENELSDSESRRSQQFQKNKEDDVLLNVSSKSKTVAASTKATGKKKNTTTNLKSDDSFDPDKIDKKSKPSTKKRGRKPKNPPAASADTLKPAAKRGGENAENLGSTDASKQPNKRRKNNAENSLTETTDAQKPASKRSRVAIKTKDILTAESNTVAIVDKNRFPEMNLREKNTSNNVDREQVSVSPRRLRRKPAVSPYQTEPKRGKHQNSASISATKATEIETSTPSVGINSESTMARGHARKSISADVTTVTNECVSNLRSPPKSLDDQRKDISKITGNVTSEEAKAPQVENILLPQNIPTNKSPERKYTFSDSSESEKEDDDEDDDFFTNSRSRKTTSSKIEAPIDIFQTPAKEANKFSKSASTQTPKSDAKFLDFSPGPLPNTSSRRLSLARKFLINRDEQECVADSETILGGSSSKKTPSKTPPASKTATPEKTSNTRLRKTVTPKQINVTQLMPSTSLPPYNSNDKTSEETPVTTRQSSVGASNTLSPSKRLRSCQKRKRQNVPENDSYEDDSGLIQTAQKRTSVLLRSEESTNHPTQFISAIDPSTLPVPHNSTIRFNLYLSPLNDPVRAIHLLSNEDYRVSWLYLLPKIYFALKTHYPIMVMLLKGSLEFRSDPDVPSLILLNSATRLIQLEAGLCLHIVNKGKETASFQITEILR